MNKDTSVVLGDHFDDFVSAQVGEGRYGSAGEVIRAGLRMLEEYEASVQALRHAIIEGEESGVSEPFDGPTFLGEMRAKHGLGN